MIPLSIQKAGLQKAWAFTVGYDGRAKITHHARFKILHFTFLHSVVFCSGSITAILRERVIRS